MLYVLRLFSYGKFCEKLNVDGFGVDVVNICLNEIKKKKKRFLVSERVSVFCFIVEVKICVYFYIVVFNFKLYFMG